MFPRGYNHQDRAREREVSSMESSRVERVLWLRLNEQLLKLKWVTNYWCIYRRGSLLILPICNADVLGEQPALDDGSLINLRSDDLPCLLSAQPSKVPCHETLHPARVLGTRLRSGAHSCRTQEAVSIIDEVLEVAEDGMTFKVEWMIATFRLLKALVTLLMNPNRIHSFSHLFLGPE